MGSEANFDHSCSGGERRREQKRIHLPYGIFYHYNQRGFSDRQRKHFGLVEHFAKVIASRTRKEKNEHSE
jgi:hypothetical protein